MGSRWLVCEVLKGMFSDEVAIRYPSANGVNAFFVPKAQVQGEVGADGRVAVHAFRKGDKAWAVLPTEDGRAIPVREADLVTR